MTSFESGRPRSSDLARELPALDTRQLHYFLTVAEQGSISGAAGALKMAQPSLSENLTRLERVVGVQLVERTRRGVILTEAGYLLAEHGRKIVDAASRAVMAVRQVGDAASGPVAVGLPPSLGLLLSVPLAETIRSEHPAVRLRISEGMSGHITEWVETGRLDLGYVYEIQDVRDLHCQPLLHEKLFFVAAADNMPECVTPIGSNATIRGVDLQALPLALPTTSHGARMVVERFARGAGIDLTVIVEIDSLPQIITMVARASAFTILPHAAVLDQVAAGTLRMAEIIEPTMTRTAYLLRKRSTPVTRASKLVQQSIELILRETIQRFKIDAALVDERQRSD